jgi:hypothetical protein
MTTETSKPVLAVADRRRIATAFCSALDNVSNTGSIVTQVCNVARSIMRGKPIPDADMDSIIADIADARKWKGPAKKVRESEARTVLATYAELPEAIKAAQDKGACNWHFALKMARLIKRGKSATAAVNAARKKSNKPVNWEGRVAAVLKAFVEAVPRKRTAALNAAQLLGVELRLPSKG